MATMDTLQFLDTYMLQAIFSQFDTDSSGVITRENIVDAMNKLGHPVSQEELDEIMQEHDIEKDNVITFNEFRSIFFDHKDQEYQTGKDCH